jgi:hypothetical protein
LAFPAESSWCGVVDRLIPPFPSPFPLGSLIVWELPEILSEFRGKRFSLLWRGRRDGFAASTFRHRCAGHSNTLTVILDRDGNIFGGFTRATWQPPRKGPDDTRTSGSFLFTLKNPHDIPPRRFPVKPDLKSPISRGYAYWSPMVGTEFGRDLSLSDMCKSTQLGVDYINDTGLDGATVFTGSKMFTLREIEIFEITA